MRCFYELLGVERSCESAELKKAYYKASLEWHPDKNQDKLIEATQKFQEIQEAYRVLSDNQERAWYDRHRDEILRGGQGGVGGTYKEERLDLFQFFTRSCFSGFDDSSKGFYTVYRHVFDDLTAEERRASDQISSSSEGTDEEDEGVRNGNKNGVENKKNVKISSFPSFGYSYSDYDSVVRPFYAFWKSFSSRKSYSWTEPYSTRNLSSRIERRAAEAENKKAREAARRQRDEEVRQLVSYVQRRDKRMDVERQRLVEAALSACERTKEHAINVRQRNFAQFEAEWVDEQAKGGLATKWTTEMEVELARIEEELERKTSRNSTTVKNSSKIQNEKGKVTDEDSENNSSPDEEDYSLHCIACEKSFASIASMKNHEASKKHKKQVSSLRSILLEDQLNAGPEGELDLDQNRKFSEYLLSSNSDNGSNPNVEVKLTKRAKKFKRRIQRDLDKGEEIGTEKEPNVIGDEILEMHPPKNGDLIQTPRPAKEKKVENKPIICSVCSEGFESKNKLFAHINDKKHAAPRPVSPSVKTRTKKTKRAK